MPSAAGSSTARSVRTPVLSKSATTPKGSVKNLPVIVHPSARLGRRGELNVRGVSSSSRLSCSVDGSLKTEHTTYSGSAPATARIHQSCEELPSLEVNNNSESKPLPDYLKSDTTKPRKKFDTIENQTSTKYGTDVVSVLFEVVNEKLTSGFYGVRLQFQANDSTGNGAVSRDALMRIISSLCGYISIEQFNNFLKRIGLENEKSVKFDDFASNFKNNETVKQEWLNPVQKKDVQSLERNFNHSSAVDSSECLYISAGFASQILKEKARSGQLDVKDLFPPNCLAPGGRIVSPQLQVACHKLGLFLTFDDHEKLWERYDLLRVGAVKTRVFFHMLGLDPKGRPKIDNGTVRTAKSAPITKRPMAEKFLPETKHIEPMTEITVHMGVEDEIVAEERREELKTQEKTEHEQSLQNKREKMKRNYLKDVPKLTNVVDMLHYKFEEGYNSMMKTFEYFDVVNEDLIPRIDFRRILREYGFPISATDLEGFLARIGLRAVQGLVNFRSFLMRFQNRSETSILNRVVGSEYHIFQQKMIPLTESTLTSEMLEARLIEYFHGDFLKLLGIFKNRDKYGISLVGKNEFEKAISKVLRIAVTKQQRETLMKVACPDSDGLIDYSSFMALFTGTPGKWNMHSDHGVMLPKVNHFRTPPQLKQLKRQIEKFEKQTDDQEENPAAEKFEHKKENESENHTNDTCQVSGDELEVTFEKVEMDKTNEEEKNSPDPCSESLRKEEEETPKEESLTIVKTPVVTNSDGKSDERSVEELTEILKDLFKNRFHKLDKSFKALDRKHTGRLDKNMFSKMLDDCHVPLTKTELESVWQSLRLSSDGMFAYRQLICHFMTNIYQLVPPPIKNKLPMESTKPIIEELRRIKTTGTTARATGRFRTGVNLRKSGPSTSRSISESLPCSGTLPGPLFETLQIQVLQRWDRLKEALKIVDREGYTTVRVDDFKEILKLLDFQLSETDINDLCNRYDLRKNGRFHYMPFMQSFVRQPKSRSQSSKAEMYTKLTHRLQKKQKSGERITVIKVMDEIREKLVTDWKTLRRAFKKMDSNSDGFLEITDFQKVLSLCNIDVTADDLFILLSEFDSNMNGKISYEDFLDQVLSA
ncbi:uncharacterized protein LOC141915362 [Tubulanus polymorphus]|uniref:uncharacterized protein LOC141915362 n=1 Tax=Tubulanus polymorphus TaxID=672921 RepID=UPI003DA35645